MAHQADRPELERKITFLSDLIKSGDAEMTPDDEVKVACSIITK